MKRILFSTLILLSQFISVYSQACAYSNVCGDGYCCKYSAGCTCSAESCREQCVHGDLMPNYIQVWVD